MKNSEEKGKRVKKCDKATAMLLCLFLGIFGAHKFYERKIRWGVLYLCTGGLLVVGMLYDFVMILCRSDPYYVRY